MTISIPAPKTVTIAGLTYDVRLTPHLAYEGHPARGLWKQAELAIDLEARGPGQLKTVSLLHEVIHGIDAAMCGGQLSDEVTEGLAHGLHQFLNGLGILIDWGTHE